MEGRGNPSAKLLVLGETVGFYEDQQGVPFVGEIGQKLQNYLNKLNVQHYISTAIKCRPTKIVQKPKGPVAENRTPTGREIQYCSAKTFELIDRMKPEVILALGSTPLNQLLQLGIGMGIARGRIYYHPQLECYVVPTWHPSYLAKTQDPIYEKQFYEDIRLAASLVAAPKTRRIASRPISLSSSLDIEKYLEKLKTVEELAFDLETTGLNCRTDRITDISFCHTHGQGVHIKWENILPYYSTLKAIFERPDLKLIAHNGRFDCKFLRAVGINPANFYFDTMLAYHTTTMTFEGEGKTLYSLEIMSWLLTKEGNYKSILEEFGGIAGHQGKKAEDAKPETPKVSKKIKPVVRIPLVSPIDPLFDLPEVEDVNVAETFFSHIDSSNTDTALLDSFIPQKRRRVPVNALTGEEFHINEEEEQTLKKYSTFVQDKLKKRITDLNLEPIQYYAAMDADVTFQIYKQLENEINKQYKEVFHNLIMPVNKTLLRLEENGILLDVEYVDKLIEENTKQSAKIQKKMFDKIGFEFNIGSGKDLQKVIYEHLKIPVDKNFMTKGGKSGNQQPSTDKEAVEHFAKKYPILNGIVEYRKIEKETSTYLEGFKNFIDPVTKRIHPSYLQHTTATGRLSSLQPNAQNIPKDNRIRNMIIPRPGWKFVTADLSQAELRILAMMSGDKKMQEAFIAGYDFHTYTACNIMGIHVEEYSKEDKTHVKTRGLAKNVNFGVVYQISAQALSADLNISLQEAQAFIDKFYNTYPDVKRWIDRTKAFAARHGYVETLYGRRRYLPFAMSMKEDIQARALRQAVNTPIQGTASDCAALGLVRVQNFIDENKLKTQPVMIIHDEIVLETPPEEVDLMLEKLPYFMTVGLPKITIPLVADAEVLERWKK
jgi:uracil-DNA glycosylase family 4